MNNGSLREYNVAIVGATGLVGETLMEILSSRKFPVAELYPLASERSAGKKLQFNGESRLVGDLAKFDFSKVDIAFFSAGAKVSAVYAPIAADAGCVVIDNTSQFRYDDDIPLIVPEVNAHCIESFKKRGIIANPNCSTAQMVVALKPIYDIAGIHRINIATYQAVSGAGKRAVEELALQTAHLLSGMDIEAKVFPKQIAFNVLPHIDVFQENGFTKEEMKMVWETKKIFEDPEIRVNPTAVRVPVFYGHSEAVHIETKKPISAAAVKKLLEHAPGVTVINDLDYPTAITDAVNQDNVFVGRIRNDIDNLQGINLWIVADNIRKGAALNAVQIAELLSKKDLL